MKGEGSTRVVLVTHLNPDLDACMAMWLMTRYVFAEREHRFRFIPVGSERKAINATGREQIVYVDTGGGKYDHHDTSDYVCTASLIAEDYSIWTPAIREMIEYTLAVDHGKVLDADVRSFDLVNIIEGLNKIHSNSPELVLEIVLSCLDAVHTSLSDSLEAKEHLKHAIYFDSRWGKGIGIVSSNPKTRYLAHRRGFQVYVYVDPIHGYRGFMAPGDSDVDFGSLFETLREVEPEADWFLHSSKQLLLCGSRKAPDRNLSSLSLEQMIDLVRR